MHRNPNPNAGWPPAARGGIPVESRIPASERTSQKLNELLTQGVAEGDARSELIKLAVRKIVEEALEAEVADARAVIGISFAGR